EMKQLEYVTDRKLVDVSKLPGTGELAKLYRKDPALPQERIDQICEAYKKKVEAFTRWQEQ
nr:hypothetical protein [Lachnospiraceae bacterium]